MAHKVAVVGITVVDFVGHIDSMPIRGGAASGRNLEMYPGGPGGNVSVGLSRLGISTSFVGQIGDDDSGGFLADDFRREGVDISHMAISASLPTGVVFVVADSGGERTAFAFRDGSADTGLTRSQVDGDFIGSCDLVFVDGVLLMTHPSVEAALAAASSAGDSNAPLIFDPNLRLEGYELPQSLRNPVERVISLSHAVLLSALEARIITGSTVLDDAAASILEMGAKSVVVKLGSEGCLVADGKNVWRVPPYSVEPIDSTGAGDGFSVGFIWGLLNTGSLREAAAIGNYVGAQVVSCKGARTGLPRLRAVQDYADAIRT